jgi:hypothetical protein
MKDRKVFQSGNYKPTTHTLGPGKQKVNKLLGVKFF